MSNSTINKPMFKNIICDLKALFPGLDEVVVSKIENYLEHDLSERELSVLELKKIAKNIIGIESPNKQDEN